MKGQEARHYDLMNEQEARHFYDVVNEQEAWHCDVMNEQDTALWSNEWTSRGNMIEWMNNARHYDQMNEQEARHYNVMNEQEIRHYDLIINEQGMALWHNKWTRHDIMIELINKARQYDQMNEQEARHYDVMNEQGVQHCDLPLTRAPSLSQAKLIRSCVKLASWMFSRRWGGIQGLTASPRLIIHLPKRGATLSTKQEDVHVISKFNLIIIPHHNYYTSIFFLMSKYFYGFLWR